MDGLNSVMFPPDAATSSPDFFPLQSSEILAPSLVGATSAHELFASFGTPEFLMKQRILPVVAWLEGERSMRCIGTAFAISCTGYVVTACHVLLDPQESGYGDVRLSGNTVTYGPNLNMGVLIPINPALGQVKINFFPFRECRYWGVWKESPLFHEVPRFESATDIAVCKIDEAPNGIAHQPLSLSLLPYRPADRCMAIGYAEMKDIPFAVANNGEINLEPFKNDLYISIGEVVEVLVDNHVTRRVPTPGPCFDFRARIPGKMSGSPIFDLEGRVVRGVVSRSFSGEKHAFGCMLSPVMDLPVRGTDVTLRKMMESGTVEGMPKVQGV